MDYKTIFEKVSSELNIPVKVVEYAYKSYWKFIREKIKELPLKDIKDEEEFLKLRTNFNIPSLGKLGITLDRFNRINKIELFVNKNKNDKSKED